MTRIVEVPTPRLGNLVDPDDTTAHRDAIHVAVAPVVAGIQLHPGEGVVLKEGVAYPAGINRSEGMQHPELVGVVDPFLPGPVLPGQRFWLMVMPNTITSLRHVWTHPAFAPARPARTTGLGKTARSSLIEAMRMKAGRSLQPSNDSAQTPTTREVPSTPTRDAHLTTPIPPREGVGEQSRRQIDVETTVRDGDQTRVMDQ